MSSQLKTEVRNSFNANLDKSMRNFVKETCEINKYFDKIYKIEQKYLENLTEIHEDFKKNFRATYYTNQKEFLIGLGNCKLSLLWSFVNSNPIENINSCMGPIRELQEFNNKFRNDLQIKENDLTWRLTDVSDAQKDLIKTYSDLCKNDPSFIQDLVNDCNPTNPEPQEQKNDESQENTLEKTKNDTNSDNKENIMQESKDVTNTDNKENILTYNQIQQKSRATQLYMQKDEFEKNIEMSGKDFNASIESLKGFYKNYTTTSTSKMESIYEKMIQSIQKFKQEDLAHLEQLKEASKGMLEVKYDYSIKKDYIPIIMELEENVDKTNIRPMFPENMNISHVIYGAKDIVKNMQKEQGNIKFENDPINNTNDARDTSSLTNQAKNIKETLKETTNEYKKNVTDFFGNLGQKLTTGLGTMGINKFRRDSEEREGSDRNQNVHVIAESLPEVKQKLSEIQLSVYEYILEVTDEQKNSDMQRVDNILAEFEAKITQDEMLRREINGLFRQKHIGSYTQSTSAFNSLQDIVNIYLSVCLKQNDFLNAVLFCYETQDFYFIKPNPEEMYLDERCDKKIMIEILAKHHMCYMEEFWIALNTHLFRKRRHFHSMKENPDIRFLQTTQSIFKNLKLCKLKQGSEKRLITVFDKIALELKLNESEENTELQSQLKDECLLAWHNIQYGNPMNFEKLELDNTGQPRLEESKTLENPELVDHNLLLYLVE